jgi:hypothetical protein
MAAWQTIYRAAGTWNEHWGRVKTILGVLVVLGAALIIGGGFLVRHYGRLGAIAIIVGSLILILAVISWVVEWRLRHRKTVISRDSARERLDENQRRAIEGIAIHFDYLYREMIHDSDSHVPALISHLGGLSGEPGPSTSTETPDERAARLAAFRAHGSPEMKRLLNEFNELYQRYLIECRRRGKGGWSPDKASDTRAVISEAQELRKRWLKQIETETGTV